MEHTNPSSNIAEFYALEKALQVIKEDDLITHELIDIYTDSQKVFSTFTYHEHIEFTRNNFFEKQESNSYFQYVRNLFLQLVSKNSNAPMYFCEKTKKARPIIQVFFQDDLKDKKYLQEAHVLSRKYIQEEIVPEKVEIAAVKEKGQWQIVKNQKEVIAKNKRPLIALSEALEQLDPHLHKVVLCGRLETILKATDKRKLTNASLKSAMKTIEKHKLVISF